MNQLKAILIGSLVVASAAQAQVRVTHGASDRDTTNADVTADGQTLVFVSNADLLSEGITSSDRHLWKYNVATGALTRLTLLTLHDSTMGNPVVNGDGSRIAFVSKGDIDVGGAQTATGNFEIWLYSSGTFTRLTNTTVNGGGSVRGAFLPAIDDTGTHVAFSSDADFLNEGQIDQDFEIWMVTLPGGTLTRLTDRTVDEDDTARGSGNVRISGNGSFVTFSSDNQFNAASIADNQFEIFRLSTAGGAPTRLTDSTSPDLTARGSTLPDIDYDGDRIVFQSDATLNGSVTGDNEVDTWLWKSGIGLLRLTDVDPDADAGQPRISGDGLSVVFSSESDFDGTTVVSDEIWLWRQGIASLERLTTTSDASRLNGTPAIDHDGTEIVFQSDAEHAGETVVDNQFEVWRAWIFADGFESGNTTSWSASAP